MVDAQRIHGAPADGGTMSRALVGMGVLVAMAFALGVSGAPGPALAAAADWLTTSHHVELEGPLGDAVREGF
jgi:hypothetical protein